MRALLRAPSIRALTIFLMLLLCSMISLAATLSGTVYDYSLTPVDGCIVTVNSTPHQQVVTRNSSYEFELVRGEYLLTAKQYEDNRLVASSEETFNLSDSGTYVLDLILFPNLDDSEQLYYDLEFDFSDDEPAAVEPAKQSMSPWLLVIGALAILFGLVVAVMLLMKKRIERTADSSDDQDDVASQVLALIRRHRRMTQKDIRKEVPVSEAKISLVLAELEAKGTIQKIKKGRGNIIVLK
jgi:uncharacterized membrane protein